MHAQKSKLSEVLERELTEAKQQEGLFAEIKEEVRTQTIRGILNSYMEHENTEMVMNMIKPYLSKKFNEKKDFRYMLGLRKRLEHLEQLPIQEISKKYFRLNERLEFTKHYIQSSGIKEIGIAFDFDDDALDSHLRRENIFFSESLKLQKEDMKILQEATPQEMEKWYDEVFRVQVAINGEKKKYNTIEVDSDGIVAIYQLKEEMDTISFKISFDIPFDADNNHIYLAISEPTFSPEILVCYDDCFETEMVPFFDEAMSLKDSASFTGEYEFAAPNKWVMPMSGAIIKTRVKKENNEY